MPGDDTADKKGWLEFEVEFRFSRAVGDAKTAPDELAACDAPTYTLDVT